MVRAVEVVAQSVEDVSEESVLISTIWHRFAI